MIIQHHWEIGEPDPPIEDLVDLVFADPPYNYGVAYDGLDDTRDVHDYRQWCVYVMGECANLVRGGGTLWWLCPGHDGWWVWEHLRKIGELLWEQPIIWHERFSQYQSKRLTRDYRLLFPVVIGSRSKLTFFPDEIREESERQRRGDPRACPGGRVPGHVWRTRRLQGNASDRVDWHPAQLPPEPLERIVRGWTRPGDTVLDAFAGRGSMGVACRKLNRHFIGLDGNAEYCDLMKERLA